MKRIVAGLGVALALALVGCGQQSLTGPQGSNRFLIPGRGSAPSSSAGATHHPFAGGLPSATIAVEGNGAALGNPSAAGLASITPIGNPTWRPADFHVFSAPIGTASDGYAEFLTTALAVLPPPNHVFNPELGVGPGAPHAPPYDTEIGNGVAAAGFAQAHRFTVSQFSSGAGVFCAWMVVPAPGTTGSSPDFASGPILGNALFPIHVAGTTFRNAQVWDPFLGTFDVPSLASLSNPFNVDGSSHFPIFFGDNMDFAPPNTPANGAYRFGVRMTDATGNGWDIAVSFTVGSGGGGGGGVVTE